MKIRLGGAAAMAGALLFVTTTATLAHEVRDVGDYTFVVGMLEEPVFAGQKSGLELVVSRGDEPVEGLEESLQATVSFGAETRDLEISPVFDEPGSYESVFFPTAAGPYSFHLTGDIEGQSIDETFTAGPDTFSEVRDLGGGQFPVRYPSMGDLARDAEAGANAATTATIALVLGSAGLLAGLVALGLTLARRRS